MRLNILKSILKFALNSMKALLEFLLSLLLGILSAFLFALPWVLRGLVVLSWFLAGFIAITKIEALYAHTLHSPIPVYALQFAMTLILLAWPVAGLLQSKKETVWGMFATGALLTGGLFWKLIPWLQNSWPETADLILSLLPSVTFIVLLIAMTLRLKALQAGKGIKLAAPAFVWLKRWKPGAGDETQTPKP